MHASSLLTLTLALLSGASALVLPAVQPDGLYQVHRSASGEEIHTRIELAPTTTSPSTSPNHLAKRAFGQTHCGCGIKVNAKDTDAAVADLKSQLGKNGHRINPAMSYYSVRGGVVAFVCNLDGNAVLKAWVDIITQAAEQITGACGKYVAGSTGAQYNFAIGYMNNAKGLDFCGKALGAPAESC